MAGGNKRSAGNSEQGPSKRSRKSQFKMRVVDVPTIGTASHVTKETQSFQVYDLPDGRLGMRREDGKVTLQVSEPASTGRVDLQDGTSLSPLLGNFHPDVPESGVSAVFKKQRKARTELRAAVRTSC